MHPSLESSVLTHETNTHSKPPSPWIVVNGLMKSYQEGDRQHMVLEDMSFEIMEGEIIALLGRSGSGKSTLLNLLGGLDRPDSGSICIHQQDLHQLSEHERTVFRRDRIGFIFQSFNLIPTLTLFENLKLPLELANTWKPSDAELIEELMAELGLNDRLQSFPDQLSGGERQRVAIGRALVNHPELILADEPTGNLDHRTSQQVQTLLKQLIRKHNRTMVVATHSSELALMADRVFEIDNAQLTEHSH